MPIQPKTQRILKIEGPPGSGKTRELAREACRLVVQDGLRPDQILILAATPQNRHQLAQALRTEASLARLSEAPCELLTFEALCLRILQPAESEIQLLSEPDAQVILHAILQQVIPPGHVLAYARQSSACSRAFFELIRQLQLKQVSPQDVATLAAHQAPDSRLPLVAEIYGQFCRQTEARHLVCYVDLVNRAAKRLQQDSACQAEISRQFPVIMADEAQELSEAQHRLLSLLNTQLVLSGHAGLSIRRYRGAEPTLFQTLSSYGEIPVTHISRPVCFRNNEAILSLLNTFLPEPLWESTDNKPEPLAEMVQFGFYTDPITEAEALADWLSRLVEQKQLNERPARWDDCVILLRSGHYKTHLINAFLEAEIPFRWEAISEGVLRAQHALYDLLSVFACLQQLAPDAGWLPTMAPTQESIVLMERANRHLLRWLEAELEDADLQSWHALHRSDADNSHTITLLLSQLANPAETAPALTAVMQNFLTLYQSYSETHCPQALSEQLHEGMTARWSAMPEWPETSAALDTFRKNLRRLNGQYKRTFERSLSLNELLHNFQTLWDGTEAEASLPSKRGQVRLLSLHQIQGEEAPFVFIPFLVSEEFPQTRSLPALLLPDDQIALGTPTAYQIDEAEEARLLAVGMSRATRQLVLSCHQSDAGTPVLPSTFYRQLLDGKRRLLQQDIPPHICWCEHGQALPTPQTPCPIDDCNRTHTLDPALEILDEADSRYVGKSAWAQLDFQDAEPLYAEAETAYLSASSIKTYMTCPRQFYYKHLLRLPQPGSDAATLGSLVHRVMELFNRQAGRFPYTAHRLRELAETMFLFEEAPEAFLETGFDENDLHLLRRLSPLTLSEMRERLLESVTDLEVKGYFSRYGKLKAVHTERALEGVQLDGIDRCRFTGMMDAVIQLEDGRWEIVDYKTFRTAYGAGLDTCDKHFRSTLDPLPDEDGLPHSTRFFSKLSTTYPKDYQLPLYYLACQQDPIYRDKLKSVALQVIRPPFAENADQGSIRLEIPGEAIKACREQLLADINRFIVEPILDSTTFPVTDDATACGSCSYSAHLRRRSRQPGGGRMSQLDLFTEPVTAPGPVSTEPLYLQGLNAQQRDAVMTAADEALQVLAGAGTGKTELISRRFIKLVKDFRTQGISNPAERILVVTFTGDAALGMRERIHQRLMNNDEEGLSLQAQSIQTHISTFHQFCMRLLRAHPLEVGLPPDFAVLNSLEQQVLFNRVVHGVLAGEQADLSDLLSRMDLEAFLPADVVSLATLAGNDIRDIENLLEPGRLFRLINRIKTAGLSPLEFLETATRQSRALTERLKQLPLPHDKDLPAPDNMSAKMDAWHDSLCLWAHGDWDPVRNAESKAEANGKKLTASVYKDELPGLAKLYLASRTFEPTAPDFAPLDEALALEEQVIRIVTAIYALYQDALLAQGACDFDDLINHGITLLSRYPGLRTHYRQLFKAVIVDEFQDSNGSQLRLLELLVQDGARNLTVVGDEKQSIYAFRFAQPENLDLIFRNGPFKKASLQTNYRSRPPVLAVANHLTTQLTHRPHQQLQACEQNAVYREPPVTWVNWDEMDDLGGGKLAHRPVHEQKGLEAQYIAIEIARLMQAGKCRFSDVAVLVKSHSKAEEIQQALAGLNIPSIRQKNLGFFEEPLIKDAMALLRLMRNLGDDVSLVRILQAKLNQRQLRDLMNLRHRLKQTEEAANLFETCLLLQPESERLPGFSGPLANAVGNLAAQLLACRKLKPRLTPVKLFLRLAKAVGLVNPQTPAWQQKQQRITLRMFERLLYLFGQNRPIQPTLDEVIETLEQYAADPNQELPVKEALSGEDAVRIMTVFAAKGLEFPVVFAAYTEQGRTHNAGDDSALIFDPQYPGKAGFGLILGRANGLANIKRELYQKCWQSPRNRTEAQRVFYVALTRAMQRLYVIRGSQSFSWTAPDNFPADAVQPISETDDAKYLDQHFWGLDWEALRTEMAALQEVNKV